MLDAEITTWERFEQLRELLKKSQVDAMNHNSNRKEIMRENLQKAIEILIAIANTEGISLLFPIQKGK